ncbi:MAG: hypothetical protein E6929_11645 [Clostridium sp.]|nr:hypothetical protein [Clostridium sp.]
MIVVNVNIREKGKSTMDFKDKEELAKYISENFLNIKSIDILNDGRKQIRIRTIEDKRIFRPIGDGDLLEEIATILENIELEQGRIKSIEIIKPKTEELVKEESEKI